MAAYVIAEIDIFDPVMFEQYRAQDGPSIDRYGGKFIVRGGARDRVEGNWEPKRLVIIEFDSMERARQWYHSPEYRDVVGLRHRSANTNLIFVEGL